MSSPTRPRAARKPAQHGQQAQPSRSKQLRGEFRHAEGSRSEAPRAGQSRAGQSRPAQSRTESPRSSQPARGESPRSGQPARGSQPARGEQPRSTRTGSPSRNASRGRSGNKAKTRNDRPVKAPVLSALDIALTEAEQRPEPEPRTFAQLGLPADVTSARVLGILTLGCTLLYAIPRTTILGAILLTGYLGGAIATHFIAGSPLFTHLLFGVYLGLFAWGGLWFRDPRVQAMIPFRA